MIPSKLLDDLPAVFRQDPFLGRFLLAFEKLAVGVDDGLALPDPGVRSPGLALEQEIAGLSRYFDPDETPAEFLPWLSGWIALTLRADMGEAAQRSLLANSVQHYRRRGTAQNLVDLITTFTTGVASITEDDAPYSFTVTVRLPPIGAFPGHPDEYAGFIDRQTAIVHALIEAEKPAHTTYQLNAVFPSLQVAVHSTVGIDTLLGSATY